jgi:hypothetical protein
MAVRSPAWGATTLQVPAGLSVTMFGAPISVHTSQKNALVAPVVVGGIGIALLCVAVAVAVMGPWPAALAVAAVSTLLTSLGAWNIFRVRAAVGTLVIYEGGLAALVGSRASAWSWDDVASVTTKERWVTGNRTVYHERRYEISKASGEMLTLLDDRFGPDVDQIACVVRDRSTASRLPEFQRTYDAGQSLAFGAVTVSRTGIQITGQNVAWADVANVVVKKGRLTVTLKSGAVLRETVWKIPNIELLGAVIGISRSDMDLVYD